jgi:zinc protease
MSMKKLLFLLLVSTFVMPTAISAQKKNSLPPVKYTEFKLKNGLRVIMHQDRSVPIVAVNVWYHVGSKNEEVGRTGFAHLFEHMMFQGSKSYDNDYFTPLQEAGANINGSTNGDRTNYYEVVPSNFLDMAIFMEADRMGGLLEAMTQDKLDNQRDVVKNERRQRYDNQPYGTAFEKASELIYAKGHGYNWTTIGSLEDLSAASMDDVKAFFRKYYVPNNATLVLAGDFDPKAAKKMVEKHFGGIPRGADIVRPSFAAPTIAGEMRKVYEDAVQLPRVYMMWHTSPAYHQDEAALDILSFILSNGRGSRLQSNLVYGKQIAQDAGSFNFAREAAGMFQITSTARPGKMLDEIEKEIDTEIARIKKEAPSMEELARAQNLIESSTVYGLQNVLGKADQMNAYATFRGKPDYFQADLDRYGKVTPADVQRVANTYLTKDRLIMHFVPRKGGSAGPRAGGANQPTSAPKAEKSKDDRSKLPGAGPDPSFALPAIQKDKLSNGLEVWLVEQNELPIVNMTMVFKSGQASDPMGMSGLASATSTLIDDGTKTRSAMDIANQTQSLGAQLGAFSGWDNSQVRLLTLTKNMDKALEIFSDVILNPEFPESEVETYRRRSLAFLLQRKDSPEAIADVVFAKVLYGDKHPYGVSPSEASVKAMKRDDLKRFYETYYRPNNAVLVVVGNTKMKAVKAKLESAFANWKAGNIPAVNVPEAAKRDSATIYLVDKPGAAQSIIQAGHVGAPRSSDDFFAISVMNSLLGGQFTSRINLNLREEKGYTYGARSAFSWRRGAGPFFANAPVQTAVTKESVMEIWKELNGVRGSIPVTDKELNYNKQSIIRRFPSGFETVDQIAGNLASMITFGLPDTYFNNYIGRISSISLADVNRVANKYVEPGKMAFVVVGDKKTIEPKLKEIEGLGGNIVYLDAEGNPVQ